MQHTVVNFPDKRTSQTSKSHAISAKPILTETAIFTLAPQRHSSLTETSKQMVNSHLIYHEPGINTVLLQSSFIFALNIVNYVLDHAIHCGLVGQILVGTAWGVPGGDLLKKEVQGVMVELGYLGLILLVYEGIYPPPQFFSKTKANLSPGGLTTSLPHLLSTLLPSLTIAATGIILPLSLSFLLLPLTSATPLQAFSSGAALSSTSLGTTFTILQSCGVVGTRIGTVLTSAAMVDDVVGLVMIAVVKELGGERLEAGTVVRPIFASLGLLAGNVGIGWGVSKVGLHRVGLGRWSGRRDVAVLMQAGALAGFVAVAGYAGASVLFAAFLAGTSISWWDGIRREDLGQREVTNSGEEIFAEYLAPMTTYLLKPFFFASIGFAIPITRMFDGVVVWQGIVYTILMFIGKFLTGVWLIGKDMEEDKTVEQAENEAHEEAEKAHEDGGHPQLTSPKSLQAKAFAPCLVGSAMVARGEIGFLIVGVAEAAGIYEGSQNLYMITIWAIFLCTILGPLSVGLLMRGRK